MAGEFNRSKDRHVSIIKLSYSLIRKLCTASACRLRIQNNNWPSAHSAMISLEFMNGNHAVLIALPRLLLPITAILIGAATAVVASPAHATITANSSVKGRGIDFALNVIANLFTDFLKYALGNPLLTADTPISEATFTDANVRTAFFLGVSADGAKDSFSAKSSFANATVPQKEIFAIGMYPETKALIGGKITSDGLYLGIPDERTAKVTFGPVDTGKFTYASTYGFGFKNGGFIEAGGEKSQPIRVPGPLPILGLGLFFGYSRKLRKLLKSSKPEGN